MVNAKDNTMRVLMALIVVLFFSQVITGCVPKKNTSQTLYASLDSATAVYNSTYDLLTELNKTGKLDDGQKVKIKAVMLKAEAGLKSAADALDLYVRSSSDENKLSFESQILTINMLIIQVTEIIGGQLE